VDPQAWPPEAASGPHSPRVVQEKHERWPLEHREGVEDVPPEHVEDEERLGPPPARPLRW
jgi:hypothetical protein